MYFSPNGSLLVDWFVSLCKIAEYHNDKVIYFLMTRQHHYLNVCQTQNEIYTSFISISSLEALEAFPTRNRQSMSQVCVFFRKLWRVTYEQLYKYLRGTEYIPLCAIHIHRYR